MRVNQALQPTGAHPNGQQTDVSVSSGVTFSIVASIDSDVVLNSVSSQAGIDRPSQVSVHHNRNLSRARTHSGHRQDSWDCGEESHQCQLDPVFVNAAAADLFGIGGVDEYHLLMENQMYRNPTLMLILENLIK